MEEKLKVFISYSSKYEAIANGLTQALSALDVSGRLELRISKRLYGALDWRKWIDDNARTADVFVLIYPNANMEMSWCNYELGRFYSASHHEHVVCIKNTDIASPPPAFQPYQTYRADTEDLMKFLRELFVSGLFSKKVPLRPEIGELHSEAHAEAKTVAATLARKFTEARLREQFHERRLVITVRFQGGQFDARQTDVEGSAEGFSLLGLDPHSPLRWSSLREALGQSVEWPEEVEAALPMLAHGTLPPALSPFRCATGIYIPVITRSESVDGVLRGLALIFVQAHEARLRPLFTWPLPQAMPQRLQSLVLVMRTIFRARWDIVEPRYRELRFGHPAPERCRQLLAQMAHDLDRLQHDYEQTGMNGLELFYELFDPSARQEIDALSQDWVQLMQALRGPQEHSAEDLAGQLNRIRANNGRWLTLCAHQFATDVDRLLKPQAG